MKRIILSVVAAIATLAASAQSTDFNANNLRFYPVNAFVNGGVGVGLGYERILDKDGKIGLNIPLQFAFSQNNDGYYPGGFNYSDVRNRFSTLFNPGVKFYPAGQRRVNYGIGMSFFGQYTVEEISEYLNTGGSQLVNYDWYRAGIMINNSVQFNITSKFNLGLEVGIGPSYINRYKSSKYNQTSSSRGIEFMAQFGMHIGYRF